MNATLAPARPQTAAGRAALVALAAREMRRFVVNPVFLFAVVMTAWTTWTPQRAVTEIDSVNPYPAIFLGGFGMMATYWLTRSMRASEPVVGVTPTRLPVRTAALCAVAVLPFLCGVLALFALLHSYRSATPSTGRSARQRRSPSSSGRSSSRRSAARCSVSRWAAGSVSRAPGSCCSCSSSAG